MEHETEPQGAATSPTAAARPATGNPTVLATYQCDEGPRQLVGQRIDGRYALSDVPAGDHCKVYLVESASCPARQSSTG